MRQLVLIPTEKTRHGGEEGLGKRKAMRPFSPKFPLHLTLRASRAQGAWRLLHPKQAHFIEAQLHRLSQKWKIRVYRRANVGNHLHLLVQAKTKEGFQGFLREFTGTLARYITQAKKGCPQGRFWDHLAFSRLVNWARDFQRVDLYLIKNLFEAQGLLAHPKARPIRIQPG